MMVGIRHKKRKFNRDAASLGVSAAKTKYQARAINPLIALSLYKKK
jgi:hypothetical protein